MKKLIKVVITSAIILGFNALAAGGGAFGGTTTGSVAHNNTVIAAGGGAFGGTGSG